MIGEINVAYPTPTSRRRRFCLPLSAAPPCRRIPTETAFSPGCRPMFSRSISCRATNNAATAALCPARRFYYTKNHELCKHNERILRGYPRKKIKNRRREVRGHRGDIAFRPQKRTRSNGLLFIRLRSFPLYPARVPPRAGRSSRRSRLRSLRAAKRSRRL